MIMDRDMIDVLRVEGPDGRSRVRVRVSEGGGVLTGQLTASFDRDDDGTIEFIVDITPDPINLS